MSTPTFALLVFTLNEREGMEQIMPKIQKEWVDEILVVDGGSTDGTIEYARANGFQVYCQKRPGFRHAYIEALELVSSDYVIPFSPDGNSIPENILALKAKALEGFEMVTCSRYLDGAKSYDDDLVTAFGNKLFTRLINFFHGAKYTDAMVMYRAVHRSVFQKLGLDSDAAFRIPERLFQTNICLMPLMSIRAARMKLRTAEIPGDEPPRIGGERKLKIIKWGLAYMFQVFYEAVCRYERRG